MKHIAEIPLPNPVRILVDLALASIGRGLRLLRHRYDATSNAAAFADLTGALRLVRRLARVMRHVLLILALRVEPPKPRPSRTIRPAAAARAPRAAASRFIVARTVRLMREHGIAKQPPPFATAPRNQLVTLTRKIEALSHVLRATMPCVRRLATRLARDLVVIGWRPPKRPPPVRDFWEDVVDTWRQATFDLSTWRRWRSHAYSS